MTNEGSPRIDAATAQALLDDGLSVREVAVRLGVSTQAVYKATKQGRLKRDAS